MTGGKAGDQSLTHTGLGRDAAVARVAELVGPVEGHDESVVHNHLIGGGFQLVHSSFSEGDRDHSDRLSPQPRLSREPNYVGDDFQCVRCGASRPRAPPRLSVIAVMAGANTAAAACAVACEMATGQNVGSQGYSNEARVTTSAALATSARLARRTTRAPAGVCDQEAGQGGNGHC
jgi:hypothetical protein